jgi:hypothetical protein
MRQQNMASSAGLGPKSDCSGKIQKQNRSRREEMKITDWITDYEADYQSNCLLEMTTGVAFQFSSL